MDSNFGESTKTFGKQTLVNGLNIYKAVTIHWTGLLNWNTGLDYWTGVFSFLGKLSIWFLKIFDTWRSQFFLKQS